MICLVSRRFHQHFGLVCKSIGTCILVRCVTFSRCCVRVNVVGSTLHFSGCCSLCDSSDSHYDYVCICVHFTNVSLLRCPLFFFLVSCLFSLIKSWVVSTNLPNHVEFCSIASNLCCST